MNRIIDTLKKKLDIDDATAEALAAAGITSVKNFRNAFGSEIEHKTKGALTKEQHASIVSKLLAKRTKKEKEAHQ